MLAEAFDFGEDVGGWTPVWDSNPGGPFGSVNAGDPSLYVGGGGINAAFGRSLKFPKSYTALHRAAFQLARLNINSDDTLDTSQLLEVPEPTKYCSSVSRCFARVAPELSTDNDPTGLVIIDVLCASDRPLHYNNFAMIYVVGPQGRGFTASQFLKSVELTGANTMIALNQYNASIVDTDKLQTVRMCLVSGGVFKHRSTTKDDVAEALIRGMAKHWNHRLSPRINFAWDQNAFQNAMKKSAPSVLI
eukprot:Gregarina_sp_Poly_1__1482@NODE_1370_length_4273_cov_48_215882_g918_i0_p1_GENE_NODE_1370_length_4273_cov_48_215882_g918_i0NODE_1370_length_4273_cov_48_215882_g918_i0_p1_ORF_typecomplete_len247_score35_37_NODE_1370_length_4273_cov_48_215882_g918_i0104844